MSAAEERFQQQLREGVAALEADAEAARVEPRRRVRRESEMPHTMLDGWPGLVIIVGSLLVLILLVGGILPFIL